MTDGGMSNEIMKKKRFQCFVVYYHSAVRRYWTIETDLVKLSQMFELCKIIKIYVNNLSEHFSVHLLLPIRVILDSLRNDSC